MDTMRGESRERGSETRLHIRRISPPLSLPRRKTAKRSSSSSSTTMLDDNTSTLCPQKRCSPMLAVIVIVCPRHGVSWIAHNNERESRLFYDPPAPSRCHEGMSFDLIEGGCSKSSCALKSKRGGGGKLFGSLRFWSRSSSKRGIVQPSNGLRRCSGAYLCWAEGRVGLGGE